MKSDRLVKMVVWSLMVAGLSSSVLLVVFTKFFAFEDASLNLLIVILLPVISSSLALAYVYKTGLAPFQKRVQGLIGTAKSVLPAEYESSKLAKGNDEIALLQALIDMSTFQLKSVRKLEKSILENAADVICLVDIHCAIVEVNPACTSVWGYKPEELIGHKLTEFLVGEESDGRLKEALGAAQSIAKLHFENRFRKKSGEIVDLLWSGHWSVTHGALFCVAHDITERKEAEKVLRESEERIRGILESLPVGVVVLNQRSYIDFMNGTARRLCKYENADMINGVRAGKLISIDKNPLILKQIDELIDKNESQSFQCSITCSDGEQFPADASASRLQIASEQNYLVSFVDQTSKHEIERIKREFFGMVSHDLRTPLMALQGFLDGLSLGAYGKLDESGTERLSGMGKSIKRLTKLVNDLLDMERLESNPAAMQIREVELAEIIEGALDSVRGLAEERGIKLSAQEAGALVMGDSDRLVQVLVNLVSNAVKFSPDGATVSIKIHETEQDVTVKVIDQGRGVPEEHKARIFDRFEQVELADSKEKGGTGLGLPICKVIIQQHAGEIGVDSRPGEGSTFWFRIPCAADKRIEREPILGSHDAAR